jgi:hypothetical protein
MALKVKPKMIVETRQVLYHPVEFFYGMDL